MNRVTVTLPDGLIGEVDRWNKNRSRFVTEAVQNELEHRRRAELRRSLENPHTDSAGMAQQGFGEWARQLPVEDTEALFNNTTGNAVRWMPGEGWTEEPK